MSNFSIKDLIDILLVATIFYSTFRLLHKSGAVNLFWGIMAFIITWLLVRYVFQLELSSALFNQLVSVGSVAIIVIFQNEIRSFFYHIGFKMGRLSHFWRNKKDREQDRTIEQVSVACRNMSASKTGALIIFVNRVNLDEYADTGEKLDAIVSTRAIENIFFKNTPLHDGALLVNHSRLDSAACILPLSANTDLPKQFGLRHRAAMGIAEKSDALAIVVSEETGHITIMQNSSYQTVLPDKLESVIHEVLAKEQA